MRLQRDHHSCGPLAALNAVEAMTGAVLPVPPFKRAAGTTKRDGTCDVGLVRALRGVGMDVTELRGAFVEAHKALVRHLRAGGAAILLTEAGGHWEAAVGVIGSRVLVYDSEETGTLSLGVQELRRRWTPWGRGRYALLLRPTP